MQFSGWKEWNGNAVLLPFNGVKWWWVVYLIGMEKDLNWLQSSTAKEVFLI